MPEAGRGFTQAEVDKTYSTIARRIVPLALVGYVVAYIDRVNVGYAKLQFVEDLGFSEAVYGFGAGLFFIGYMLFEIPSNLYLERGRGAPDADPDHGPVGPDVGGHGVHLVTRPVLRHALPARRGGSGVLSGHHPLPELLVPASTPRPGHVTLYRWRHDRGCDWQSALGLVALA